MGSMSMFNWIVAGLVLYAIYTAFSSLFGIKSGPDKFCTTCGHVGQCKTATKGSMGIEIVLWLCFLVPGLIYSIWRLTSRHQACSSCGAVTVIPLDSPIAKKMMAP